MRIGLLSPLALALLAGFSLPAQASSDDSCYPDWRVSRDSYEPCSNQPFLSPGNDSRVNPSNGGGAVALSPRSPDST